MSDGLQLSIVIPCLNEAKTILEVIREAKEGLANAQLNGEIIIADNGSTDGSKEIARSAGATVIPVAIKGYGAALHYGIIASKGPWILFADADLSYDFRALSRFTPFILEQDPAKQRDLVLGSRLKGEIEKGAMPWLNRYVGTPVLSLMIYLFFDLKTSDCNSGMRLIRRDFYKKIPMRAHGMEWASELLIKTAILGKKYTEIPIPFRKDKRDRAPHLKRWRDGWRHLKTIVLLSPNRLMGIPTVLCFIGFLAAFVLKIYGFSIILAIITVAGIILILNVKLLLHTDGVRQSGLIKRLLNFPFAETLLLVGSLLFISGLMPISLSNYSLEALSFSRTIIVLAGAMILLESFFWGTIVTHGEKRLVAEFP